MGIKHSEMIEYMETENNFPPTPASLPLENMVQILLTLWILQKKQTGNLISVKNTMISIYKVWKVGLGNF